MASSPKGLNTTVAALSAVALWGLAFPLIQEGLAYVSPVMLGFLRFAMASAVVLAVVSIRHPMGELVGILRVHWRLLLLFGALYVTIPNIAQNMALENGTSSMSCVIQSSSPALTLLFAVIILGERMTGMKAIGTGISIAGAVMLVTSKGVSFGNEDFVSNILMLVSGLAYGLSWVVAKPVLDKVSAAVVIGLSLPLGTVMLGVAVPFESGYMFEASLVSIVDVVLLGVACAGLSSVLFLHALEHEEVSRMSFFIYLMPVFASLFAWVIRDEGVAAWTIVCGAIIVFGIYLATSLDGPRTRLRGKGN
jgi:drug/metabolite transporter (DMT)-like permease